MRNWETRLADMVSSAAQSTANTVKDLASNGINIDLRLFYLPATQTEDGKLFVCEINHEPEGSILGSEDRFHGGIPYENYWSWLRQRIGALPLLATSFTY